MVDLTVPPLPVTLPNVAGDLEQAVESAERAAPDLGSESALVLPHETRGPSSLPIADSELAAGGPPMPYFEPKAAKMMPSVSSLPNELPTTGTAPSTAAGVTLATAISTRLVEVAAAKDVVAAAVNSATPANLNPAKSSSATKPSSVGTGSVKETINNLSVEEIPFAISPRVGGTDAARQHVAMSIAEVETKPKSKALDTTALPQNSAARIPRAIESSKGSDFSSGDPQTDSDSSSQTNAADPAMPLSANAASASAQPEPPQNVAHAEQVTRVLNTVTEAIERLQSDGRTNVEMQIKLRDGEQVTVKLQMQAGEVRTIFKTDSSELREAISRAWSNFSSSSAERGVRVTTPVFESPGAQPGLNDFNNQRHDRREQAEGTASGHSLAPPVFKKSGRPALSPTTSAPAASPHRQASTPTPGLAAWA